MLEIEDLHAWYGKSHVLDGVNLSMAGGRITSVLGRNGAGRSTLLKAIMGAVEAKGRILFKGAEVMGEPSHRIARLGIGYVPEDRGIFPALSVEQNLILGIKDGRSRRNIWGFDETYEAFPRLRDRAGAPAGVLSGGEQQMLTICRTLMGEPDLIMIDEPTEGLAPQMVERVAQLLKRVTERGISIVLVEQKLTIALDISDDLYVMGHGKMVFHGSPSDLTNAGDVRRDWLEV